MKVLKIIGIIVLVIIILGVGVIIFGPTEVHMERQTTIDAPVEAVFTEVNGFKTFDQFSAWAEVDTTAQIIVEGPASGVGARYSWRSDNPDLGSGSIEIIESDKNMLVKSKMEFDGFEGNQSASWILNEVDGMTEVTYTYDWEEISGFLKLFALATESMLDPMYNRTLEKLKNRVESRPDFVYDIEQTQTTSSPYLGAKASSSTDPAMIGQVMGETYGKVMSFMSANKIEMAGPPISIVLSYDEEGTEMICAIPTANQVDVGAEGMMSGMTYEGLALKTIHKGDYDLMESAYNDLMAYISYYNFDINGNPWEVYVTDPGAVPDTTEWITEIYFPVK